MTKPNTPCSSWNMICKKPVQPVTGAGPCDPELREGRHVQQTDFFVYVKTLLSDKFKVIASPETPFLDRLFALDSGWMVSIGQCVILVEIHHG